MAEPAKADLDALVAQAIVDAYDEHEQRTGFHVMIEDGLDVPFQTSVLGMTPTGTGSADRKPRRANTSTTSSSPSTSPWKSSGRPRSVALSTRARITATSFTNEYHWGDFRGDPRRMMQRYYDAHLYVANWGTHRVMLRLPRALLACHAPGQRTHGADGHGR
ncbi:calcium-binding protein [Actinomadura vinacea]|uniref:calcium-binding protein n=1 Tax=Actinomadura vinacea TaxID=115336 RepID=UPI0031DF7973